jgi:Na+-transporting methylmalonyl-CoA/oxaloacetate decarboxylase gamma subunit
MASREQEEENHWPGYVDALTTMTMMLIFIMTILAVAIFGMSQNVSRAMMEKVAKALNVETTDNTESNDKLAERLVARIEDQNRNTLVAQTPPPPHTSPVAAKPDVPPLAVARTEPPAPEASPSEPEHKLASSLPAERDAPPKPALVAERAAFITIAFEKRATGLDAETSAKLKAAMADRGAGALEIRAYAERSGAVSDARRIAFYRLLNLRTQLIAMGVPAERINARIEEAVDGNSGDVVQIGLAKAG